MSIITNTFVTAIQTAWDILKATFIEGGGSASYITNTTAPWIDFNPDTNRLFLTADEKFFNSEPGPTSVGRMKLIFNDRLYELFASMPYRLITNPIDLNFLQTLGQRPCAWYSIRFINRYNNKYTQKITDPTSTITPNPSISIDVLQAHQVPPSSLHPACYPSSPPKRRPQKTSGVKAII